MGAARSSKYRRLLAPGYIGPVKIKTRLIKTGSNPGFYPYDGGFVQPLTVDYYEALAAGGVGLVTVGGGEIDYPIGTVATGLQHIAASSLSLEELPRKTSRHLPRR